MKFFKSLILVLGLIAAVFSYPAKQEQEETEDFYVGGPRLQRQAGGGGGHHDVVDFGAHTGDHGSFGWYADFPVGGH